MDAGTRDAAMDWKRLAYFTIGWYVATLVGTTVSMLVVVLSTLAAPHRFDWSRLNASMDPS